MINFQKTQGMRILELGGGDNPHPQTDVNVDVRSGPKVHFTADFNEPLPIGSDDFDGVFSQWAIEHVSWRKVPQLLSEMNRVVKPGSKCILVLPNTEAQMRYIQDHPDGWEERDCFTSASVTLFGDQDYTANAHASYFSPAVVTKLLVTAGFANVVVRPYGAIGTDMVVEALKPSPTGVWGLSAERVKEMKQVDGGGPLPLEPESFRRAVANLEKAMEAEGETYTPVPLETGIALESLRAASIGFQPEKATGTLREVLDEPSVESRPLPGLKLPDGTPVPPDPDPEPILAYSNPLLLDKVPLTEYPAEVSVTTVEVKPGVYQREIPVSMTDVPGTLVIPPEPEHHPEKLFGRTYFNGGRYSPFYWDSPEHEVTTRFILARSPKSVLEIGCGRGYIGKRLQDAGVDYRGIEISKHCLMTRVCDDISQIDLCIKCWTTHKDKYDFCFSQDVLSHIPGKFLPQVVKEMARTCKWGLHGIDLNASPADDPTRVSMHPRDWWLRLFKEHAPGWPVEVVDKADLERDGVFAKDWLTGEGVKLNLGSGQTMFHRGWVNVDGLDLGGFAANFNYNYLRHDLTKGVPFATAGVDCIYMSHVLEHFTYAHGAGLLRECRRVLKPGGALRILVPDAQILTMSYDRSMPGSDQAPSTPTLDTWDEINEGCANSPTAAGKLHALLWEGHSSAYDWPTLEAALVEAGFVCNLGTFRRVPEEAWCPETNRSWFAKAKSEVVEMTYDLSLIVDAVPRMDV